MKLVRVLNNNANEYSVTVFENDNQIIASKHETNNYYDYSLDEKTTFNTVNEYLLWESEQNWIDKNKIRIIRDFRINPLKGARGRAGLTQQQMSDMLDIPKRTIEDWENSRRTPPKYVEELIVEKLISIIKE